MYSRKSIEPRIEHWRTTVLMGYSCKDFPSRTTQSCLLPRNGKTRPTTQTEIPLYEFVKKTSEPNPVKSHEYIKCQSSHSNRLI